MIDWDTVALAEPERDLWMLDSERHGLGPYTETTGQTISHAGIEFYRLAWTLSDIASFTRMFRSQPVTTSWLDRKWHGFVALVEGASAAPYAPS
jgi:spectinomycin phosphotransferase